MEYKFTTANFQEEVLESSLPVLVDFYADWCGPCKMMAPIVAALAEKYDGYVNRKNEPGIFATEVMLPL